MKRSRRENLEVKVEEMIHPLTQGDRVPVVIDFYENGLARAYELMAPSQFTRGGKKTLRSTAKNIVFKAASRYGFGVIEAPGEVVANQRTGQLSVKRRSTKTLMVVTPAKFTDVERVTWLRNLSQTEPGTFLRLLESPALNRNETVRKRRAIDGQERREPQRKLANKRAGIRFLETNRQELEKLLPWNKE